MPSSEYLKTTTLSFPRHSIRPKLAQATLLDTMFTPSKKPSFGPPEDTSKNEASDDNFLFDYTINEIAV